MKHSLGVAPFKNYFLVNFSYLSCFIRLFIFINIFYTYINLQGRDRARVARKYERGSSTQSAEFNIF